MKKLVIALCAAVLAMGLAACGGTSGASSSAVSDSASSASAASSEAASSAAATESSVSAALETELEANEGDLTAEDLANVDITIEYGDFDGMSALAKEIQNYQDDGKVLKIDGVVLHFAEGMSYNIAEVSADGKEKKGTSFIIQGADESAYPADGTHVIITGMVVEDGLARHILTLPEFVEVVED